MNVKFKVGDKIQLNHLSSAYGHARSENVYISQVLDFDHIRTVKIAMPIFEGRIIPLDEGDEYHLCFFTDSGMFRSRGRIAKRYEENKLFVAEITLLTELKKYQRRQYYRLDCMIEFEYRIVSEEEQLIRKKIEENSFTDVNDQKKYMDMLDQYPKEWYDAVISDLSGGGLRFHCNHVFEKGQMLEVTIPLVFLNGVIPIHYMAEVLSCSQYENKRSEQETRAEFRDITDTEREQIIQYVFEQQRRRLKKE